MKILLVDDSISIRKVILRTLYELGHKKVYEAENGSEGLTLLKKIRDIDLIIVDWEMPVMNGLDFIKKVRESDLHKNIKIVMATSKNTKENVITALKSGADNYIAKPFSDKTLATHLKPIIDSMKPSQSSDDFIKNFSGKEIKKFQIKDNMIELVLEDKIIKIDIPLVMYHGALHVEDIKDDDDFIIIDE